MQHIAPIFGNYEVKQLPFLATSVMQHILAIFGNFKINKNNVCYR